MTNSTFLKELARILIDRYSGDLSSLDIMFPSLRARTFFVDAIAETTSKPVWQPSWTTIDEIMEQVAGISRGERIRLIAELYQVYVKHHPGESFDKFYFWGDMLISDFDLIDKYMVDASQLLRNIEEIKELEADVSYLTPEQLRIISFWKSIGDNDSLTEQKQRFLKVWRSLPAIYNEYRTTLLGKGIGYTGMIYRMAAERLKSGDAELKGDRRYIVAGFNALSDSEKVLFDHLQSSAKDAEFYWDYDSYYVANNDHEAGMFLRENLSRYPATEPISHDCFKSRTKKFRSIACVSNVVQCKYVAKLLEELPTEERDKRTAIVLTDENMLVPLLHSLPESIPTVNITMGYPLKNTLVYTFIDRLIELQAHSRERDGETMFYHNDVSGLLTHPYITDYSKSEAKSTLDYIVANHLISVESAILQGNELLSAIFQRTSDWESLASYIDNILTLLAPTISAIDELQGEYLTLATDELKKCRLSITNCGITPSVDVFCSLLRRHLQTVSIPYEGEPLEGVQIMGILETRNLDFKNVIILSMTDDNFPGDKTGQSSFIPYNLRAAYSMPTPEEHEAMYAYYFYRLVQRAESVTMLYCSRADERSTGEQSRYIYQLEYESPHKIEKRAVGVDLSLDDNPPIEVAKGKHEQEILNRYLDPSGEHSLSPTALFRYVECPLKFYLASIAKLRTNDELSDTIDALTFGNILHESMEELYTPILKVANPNAEIKKLANRDTIAKAVDNTMCRLLMNSRKLSSEEFSGDMLLVRDIIIKYIQRGIMRYDIANEGYTIAGLEKDVDWQCPISDGRMVNLSGRADRIDRRADGSLQIIDYKSGNTPHLEYNGMEALFRGEAQERVSNIFQTMLYSMILHRKFNLESCPSLYFASKMLNDDYSPLILDRTTGAYVERYSDISEEFESELHTTLEELFDYSTPFRQTEDEDMCKYCDFKKICRR